MGSRVGVHVTLIATASRRPGLSTLTGDMAMCSTVTVLQKLISWHRKRAEAHASLSTMEGRGVAAAPFPSPRLQGRHASGPQHEVVLSAVFDPTPEAVLDRAVELCIHETGGQPFHSQRASHSGAKQKNRHEFIAQTAKQPVSNTLATLRHTVIQLTRARPNPYVPRGHRRLHVDSPGA